MPLGHWTLHEHKAPGERPKWSWSCHCGETSKIHRIKADAVNEACDHMHECPLG